MNTMSPSPSPCHYCGNPNVKYIEIKPDYEFCFGPSGPSHFHIACTDCGLRGGSVSMADVPLPAVTHKYNLKTWMGTFPIEEYAPQDLDAEIKKLAIDKWNSMPAKYRVL